MAELDALRTVARARELCEKVEQERRVTALVLILRHLADHGYLDSYERLTKESGVTLAKLDTADNIDLTRILIEFEESYLSKYGRKPRLCRKVTDQGGGLSRMQQGPLQPSATNSRRSSQASSHPTSNGSTPPETPPTGSSGGGLSSLPPVSGAMAARQRREKAAAAAAAAAAGAGAATTPGPVVAAAAVPGAAAGSQDVSRKPKAGSPSKQPSRDGSSDQGSIQPGLSFRVDGQSMVSTAIAGLQSDAAVDLLPGRLLKPLPLHLTGEYGELAAAISRDIYVESPDVSWEQIAGLDEAKRLLKEAVVMPIRYPDLFTGLLAPWKGILLYGPPGTGKTLLAKAVATECSTTFFNISASSIISKWRGDSEKLVRVLFDLARHHAPSTIFLDEIDALMGARGGGNEHEASRRMKTELLIQLDGLAKSEALVFVLAATNLPWELDVALLRRLEKRIMVPLPSAEARAAMFSNLLGGRCTPDVQWQQLAAATDGYSGSDVRLAAKEAAMRPLRRLMEQLEPELTAAAAAGSGNSSSSSSRSKQTVGGYSTSTSSSNCQPTQQQTAAGGASQCGQTPDVDKGEGSRRDAQPLLGAVTAADVAAALAATKPSAQLHSKEYALFTERYGQVA